MKMIVSTIAATALLVPGADALAQDLARTVKVSYADLDLSRSGGRDMLERRIALAVRKVCPDIPHPLRLQDQAFHSACQKTAWDGALRQVAAIGASTQLADATIKISGKPR